MSDTLSTPSNEDTVNRSGLTGGLGIGDTTVFSPLVCPREVSPVGALTLSPAFDSTGKWTLKDMFGSTSLDSGL